MLDNREIASLIWLGIALVGVLAYKKTRSIPADLFRALFKPVILIPLLFMLAYIGLEVWLASHLGLWDTGLLKGTIIWTVASATVLAFAVVTNSDDSNFFRKTVAGTVGVVVFLEFFMNVMVMDLWAEFVLQPVAALTGIFAAVAGMNVDYKRVKIVTETLSAVLGCSLLAFTVWQLHTHWPQLNHPQLLRELFLPLWLTIGLLPFLYLFRLYVAYDAVWRGINSATVEPRARWRARAALVRTFHIRSRNLAGFPWIWWQRVANAPTYKAAREILDHYRTERRKVEQAEADEQERLERYAGVEGTDDYGQCLDRREFKETMDTLRWVHTCQMGWYRNLDGRYRTDLLDILASDFTRRGLPTDHGITLQVAGDGQSWYAWRRTITGWCFAIGAAGPPPEMWEFDGPEPPRGFPGKDPDWGERPFSDEANKNWW